MPLKTVHSPSILPELTSQSLTGSAGWLASHAPESAYLSTVTGEVCSNAEMKSHEHWIKLLRFSVVQCVSNHTHLQMFFSKRKRPPVTGGTARTAAPQVPLMDEQLTLEEGKRWHRGSMWLDSFWDHMTCRTQIHI